jgi:hypothetical protein
LVIKITKNIERIEAKVKGRALHKSMFFVNPSVLNLSFLATKQNIIGGGKKTQNEGYLQEALILARERTQMIKETCQHFKNLGPNKLF